MFNYMSATSSVFRKRFWLHLGERVAAKQSHRWPELAATCDLDAFRSFEQSDQTVFTYAGVEVGTTTGDPTKYGENTLSDFMNALRMVVAAYERCIRLGDLLLQGESPTAPPIVLCEQARLMLFSHPQFVSLQMAQEAEGALVVMKQVDRNGLHTFHCERLPETA